MASGTTVISMVAETPLQAVSDPWISASSSWPLLSASKPYSSVWPPAGQPSIPADKGIARIRAGWLEKSSSAPPPPQEIRTMHAHRTGSVAAAFNLIMTISLLT